MSFRKMVLQPLGINLTFTWKAAIIAISDRLSSHGETYAQRDGGQLTSGSSMSPDSRGEQRGVATIATLSDRRIAE